MENFRVSPGLSGAGEERSQRFNVSSRRHGSVGRLLVDCSNLCGHWCCAVYRELMKEDYSEIQHKKTEVFHLCNYCTQILEKMEQL